MLGEPWEMIYDEEDTARNGRNIPPPCLIILDTGIPCPGTPGIDRRRHLAPPTPAPANKRMKVSLTAALQFTQSAELRERAQNEYMDAVYVQQTVNSKTALRQTWAKVSQSLGYEVVEKATMIEAFKYDVGIISHTLLEAHGRGHRTHLPQIRNEAVGEEEHAIALDPILCPSFVVSSARVCGGGL